MIEPCHVSPTNTFVVRFWQEWSAAGSRWRGQVEHVQSGKDAPFLEMESILDFIRSFGVMADESRSMRQGKED
jgi:hypothetical protein